MKKLAFVYHTKYTFDSHIYDHHYTLKIYPRESSRQRILSLLESVSYGDSHSYSIDEMGNKTLYGNIDAPHNTFEFEVNGIVVVDGTKSEDDSDMLALFRTQSSMTKVTREFIGRLNEVCSLAERKSCSHKAFEDMEQFEKITYLSDCCHEMITYTQNVTDVNTNASEALRLGKGVCQDYSHILIAFLRAKNIPARYVVGFMSGEGYTHAWVEAFCDGKWIGLDPTNSKLVDENYIKLSHGRDYNDTMVCKGHFYGNALQKQDIKVLVTEV